MSDVEADGPVDVEVDGPVDVEVDAPVDVEADSPTDAEAPAVCPVCSTPYDSVSLHDHGLMVNLLDNARYRRVCFDPVEHEGRPHIRFYHHTHEQVGADE